MLPEQFFDSLKLKTIQLDGHLYNKKTEQKYIVIKLRLFLGDFVSQSLHLMRLGNMSPQ